MIPKSQLRRSLERQFVLNTSTVCYLLLVAQRSATNFDMLVSVTLTLLSLIDLAMQLNSPTTKCKTSQWLRGCQLLYDLVKLIFQMTMFVFLPLYFIACIILGIAYADQHVKQWLVTHIDILNQSLQRYAYWLAVGNWLVDGQVQYQLVTHLITGLNDYQDLLTLKPKKAIPFK